jgi:uncharacterized protein YggT (Ycf19 family)
MTDYERTTVRETTTADPSAPVYDDPPVEHASTVRSTERVYEPGGPSGATTIARVITFAFGLLQVALVLRIVLLLLVANPGNDVVSLILGVTDPFVEPFRGMFALDRVTGDQGSQLDIAALVALIAWTLIEALILAAIRIFDRREATAV